MSSVTKPTEPRSVIGGFTAEQPHASPQALADKVSLSLANNIETIALSGKRTFPRTQNSLLTILFLGDCSFSFLALVAAYYLRFNTSLRHLGPPPPPDFGFGRYLPMIVVGTVFMVLCLAYLKLYDPRILLRPLRSAETILRATLLWFLLVVSVGYLFKVEPSISRFFTTIVIICTVLVMVGWRHVFHLALLKSRWRERITQRLAFIGWSEEAAHLARTIASDHGHSFSVCGIVQSNGKTDGSTPPESLLGHLDQLETLIDRHLVDTVVLVDLELPRDRIIEIAATCERRYVEFKIIPSFFQIFLSGLQTQTIAGVPLLGVEALPLDNIVNRVCKRALDIVGGLVGLAIALPVMAVLTVLIKRESPGPAFFRQVRSGRHGQPFAMYKLRSMHLDAERDTGPQWTVANDPRRLKVGRVMREWNLDELPQFWNVLVGDMSLVGPRPERPELIAQFEKTVRNYHSRHEIRPGMTGWAQVNGLRGNTSLSERIRYDLHYIENWSLLLDLQILMLTLVRRDNAY